MLRMNSVDDLPEHLRALNAAKLPAPASTFQSFAAQTGQPEPAGKARGRPVGVGKMNKTEQAYAEHLEGLRIAGQIVWFAFEAWRFRLADRTYYNPDFIVMTSDGFLEAHEVKGHWEDDARVKIKVAAQKHPPIQFLAVQRKAGAWTYERF